MCIFSVPDITTATSFREYVLIAGACGHLDSAGRAFAKVLKSVRGEPRSVFEAGDLARKATADDDVVRGAVRLWSAHAEAINEARQRRRDRLVQSGWIAGTTT